MVFGKGVSEHDMWSERLRSQEGYAKEKRGAKEGKEG